jgi:UPF0755 protein
MKIVKHFSKGSLLLLIILVGLGVSAWRAQAWWKWASAPVVAELPASASSQKVMVQIPQGTSAQEIGQKLEAEKLIRSATAWSLWTRWMSFQNPQGSFQAGSYEVSANQPLTAIAQKIWAGDVITRSFTIPEGWSLRQMAAYFEQQGYFKATDFVKAVSQVSYAQYPWLPANLPNLEGYLYPDTYQIVGTEVTPDQVVQQMLRRFEQVALPVYNQNRDRTRLTLDQWVNLASIVEKEAVVPSERRLIAGVFTNRLTQNISLGSDPTVEYGLGVTQTPDQPLTLAQVRTPNPYNTYLNVGLPPTPIASPGIASLKATLDPETTDYLYFVARYDGTHVFSRTLAEHETAQAKIHDGRDAQQAAKEQTGKAKPKN